MSNKVEVRKLPKKTIYMILGLIAVGIVTLLLTSMLKQAKIAEVLATLEHPNVKSVTVYNVTTVKDETTGRQGDLYKISFTDLDKNKECMGLILKQNGKYTKDIDCK